MLREFPQLVRIFLLVHHVRRGVHSGQEAGSGCGLRDQRQRGSLPEPELRGSAGPVSVCGEAVLRPDLPRRARVSGLRRAGPQLLQSPRSHLEETLGKRTRVWIGGRGCEGVVLVGWRWWGGGVGWVPAGKQTAAPPRISVSLSGQSGAGLRDVLQRLPVPVPVPLNRTSQVLQLSSALRSGGSAARGSAVRDPTCSTDESLQPPSPSCSSGHAHTRSHVCRNFPVSFFLHLVCLVSALGQTGGKSGRADCVFLHQELVSNPEFIVGGATRTDICQGALGKALISHAPEGTITTAPLDGACPQSSAG